MEGSHQPDDVVTDNEWHGGITGHAAFCKPCLVSSEIR
jgi:hypothetical protein